MASAATPRTFHERLLALFRACYHDFLGNIPLTYTGCFEEGDIFTEAEVNQYIESISIKLQSVELNLLGAFHSNNITLNDDQKAALDAAFWNLAVIGVKLSDHPELDIDSLETYFRIVLDAALAKVAKLPESFSSQEEWRDSIIKDFKKTLQNTKITPETAREFPAYITARQKIFAGFTGSLDFSTPLPSSDLSTSNFVVLSRTDKDDSRRAQSVAKHLEVVRSTSSAHSPPTATGARAPTIAHQVSSGITNRDTVTGGELTPHVPTPRPSAAAPAPAARADARTAQELASKPSNTPPKHPTPAASADSTTAAPAPNVMRAQPVPTSSAAVHASGAGPALVGTASCWSCFCAPKDPKQSASVAPTPSARYTPGPGR